MRTNRICKNTWNINNKQLTFEQYFSDKNRARRSFSSGEQRGDPVSVKHSAYERIFFVQGSRVLKRARNENYYNLSVNQKSSRETDKLDEIRSTNEAVFMIVLFFLVPSSDRTVSFDGNGSETNSVRVSSLLTRQLIKATVVRVESIEN